MRQQEMLELADIISKAVVTALKSEGLIGNARKPINERSAYAKTEALLFNYNGFKKIVADKQAEILCLRTYGVPQSSGNVGERVQGGSVQKGIVLPEESVESAVRNVEKSMESTLKAISLIDAGMATLVNDPYYKVLEMRYFEGRTQEDIAASFGCNQATIARNKSRLVNELSMRMFPDQVVEEMLT